MFEPKSNTPKKLYGSLRSDSRCRSCLKICDANHNTNIFKPGNNKILLIAEQLLGEKLQRHESLPHLLCRPCTRRFNNLIEFKKVIVESQQKLAAEARAKRCVELSPLSVPAAKVTKTAVRTNATRRGLFECDKNEVNYGLKLLIMSF